MLLRASPRLCPVLVHLFSQIFSPCPHTPARPPWGTHMLSAAWGPEDPCPVLLPSDAGPSVPERLWANGRQL